MKTKFDTLAVAQGYCCDVGFICRNAKPTPQNTSRKLAVRLGVDFATLKRNRALFREGVLKCRERPTCQAALWVTEQARREAKERNEDQPEDGGAK